MQFKHLALKAKGSLFLMLLFGIGIGVFVMINTGGEDKHGDNKKHSTEVNSSVNFEESKRNPGENNNPETDSSSKSDGGSKPEDGDKKVTPEYKPDFGTVDGGEYNNNFRGRVEVYENPFFGMKVNFPMGWTMEDKNYQDTTLGEVFDSSKYYLFTAVVLDKKLTLGVRAEKYPDGALKYLEGEKDSTKYYIEDVIGPNSSRTQKESKQTEISEVTINNNMFYQFSVTQFFKLSYFVYPWKNGVIVFKIVGSADADDSQMLKDLLEGTTIGDPSLSKFAQLP
ncbi:MAG: hypothetical protein K0R18_1097 [Bacillales bacterium]|jgi:hypothetical protein|nr:hypothetical protein [Bacillales bacterium]